MKPTYLTPELSATIVELVRRGVPISQAAEHVGIGRTTVREWIRRGEDRDTRPGSAVFEEFATDMRAARAARLADVLEMVGEGAKKDWRAAAWEAERGWPEEFGQRTRTDITSGGRPMTLALPITDIHNVANGTHELTDDGREALDSLRRLIPDDAEHARRAVGQQSPETGAEREHRHADDLARIEALRAERKAREAGAAPALYLPEIDADSDSPPPVWRPESDDAR